MGRCSTIDTSWMPWPMSLNFQVRNGAKVAPESTRLSCQPHISTLLVCSSYALHLTPGGSSTRASPATSHAPCRADSKRLPHPHSQRYIALLHPAPRRHDTTPPACTLPHRTLYRRGTIRARSHRTLRRCSSDPHIAPLLRRPALMITAHRKSKGCGADSGGSEARPRRACIVSSDDASSHERMRHGGYNWCAVISPHDVREARKTEKKNRVANTACSSAPVSVPSMVPC
ncbi:hypothetical protein K438DRAFT_1863383 [Mycena galopus ATCC 62051]|nr:hypothetical protein K438DRAFT_1863383 [Mycena galopus ATCC 62051]